MDLITARATLARAEDELAKRERELADAIEAYSMAAAAYDATESAADEKRAIGAEVKKRSKERLVSAARAALERAKEDHDRFERAQQERDCAAAREKLRGWAEALAPAVTAIVAADRSLDAAIARAVAVVADAQDGHGEFESLCRALGQPMDVPRPEVATARRLMRKAVSDARAAEDRDDLTNWLVTLTADWRTAGMSDGEVAAMEQIAARNALAQQQQQQSRDVAAAYAAGAADGAAKKQEQST